MLAGKFSKADFSCCANWALRKTSPKNLPDFKQRFEKNFYMDDFFKSNVDEMIELSKKVISILLLQGFRLTKWVSNSCEI